jgi:hypothetical protein
VSTVPDTYQAQGTPLPGMKQFGVIAGVLGAVLAVAGFFMSGADRFFQAYLVAYTFWMGVVLGSLALLMVQHLSGGVWGVVLRRPFEAAVRTIPVMAVLFIPIALGMHSIYEWSHAGITDTDPIIAAKALYLNTPFFLVRQVIYFLVWGTLGHLLTRWSAEHDRSGDPRLLKKMENLSGGGLVLYFLTVTFAMVDWTMSVNPHWFSTIWGMLYVGGQGLSAFAFGICVLVMLAQTAPLNGVLTSHHFHDLGKLLFAFLMLWAYLSFSQFLIVYSANLSEEIPHYLARSQGGWQYITIVLIVLHFIVPYSLLLSRDVKRGITRLRAIAAWLILMRIVDYYWQVAPEFNQTLSPSIADIGLPIALGGIFFTLYAMRLKSMPLLPAHDPGLEKALTHHVH